MTDRRMRHERIPIRTVRAAMRQRSTAPTFRGTVLAVLHSIVQTSMISPSKLQIYGVERSDDHGGVCTVRCITGIVRIGQVFTSDDSSEGANGDSTITLTAIERYRKSVDFFDPPNTARVSLSGNSVGNLGRGSILSCVHETP
jgi:hypothetical protein